LVFIEANVSKQTIARPWLIGAAIAASSLAIGVTAAFAASTRSEYVAQVDPVCQSELAQERAVTRPATKKVQRIETRGLDLDKELKLVGPIIARGYNRLAAIQRDADSMIASIPPAPGDEAVVSSWLGQRAAFTDLFQRSAQAIAHQHRRRFFSLLFKALGVEQTAAETIQEFGFASCVQIVPGSQGS
jgi:hypothetical protein